MGGTTYKNSTSHATYEDLLSLFLNIKELSFYTKELSFYTKEPIGTEGKCSVQRVKIE